MRTVFLMLKHDPLSTVLLGLMTLGWVFIITMIGVVALTEPVLWALVALLVWFVIIVLGTTWRLHAGTQKIRERTKKSRSSYTCSETELG